MLDDPAEVIGAALLKLGYPLNSGDPLQLQRARGEAIAIKPYLRAYINAEVRDQLIAGDVIAAQAWSVTAQSAINSNPALRYVYPAEGFALYADCAQLSYSPSQSGAIRRFIRVRTSCREGSGLRHPRPLFSARVTGCGQRSNRREVRTSAGDTVRQASACAGLEPRTRHTGKGRHKQSLQPTENRPHDSPRLLLNRELSQPSYSESLILNKSAHRM